MTFFNGLSIPATGSDAGFAFNFEFAVGAANPPTAYEADLVNGLASYALCEQSTTASGQPSEKSFSVFFPQQKLVFFFFT